MNPNMMADAGSPSVFRNSIMATIENTSVWTSTWTDGTNSTLWIW
ncbi:Uncharacterised protein [Mycobacterium tuberculosis]|nr:Uncharacterised protein [Mycobacterium tuberculosis]